MTEPSASLAATAYWTAAVRAVENHRADRIFDDPWAALLAGKVGAEWVRDRTPESLAPIVLRTRYFDDFLERVSRETGVRQFVLLGAGLDTRAFRLGWPEDAVLYEVDQPAVLVQKERVLSRTGARPRCARWVVEADLTRGLTAALTSAGFDPLRSSAWLVEGLLFYLPEDVIQTLLADVTSMAAEVSRLGFDVINRETLTSPLTRPWIEMQQAAGAPWMGCLDDPLGFMRGLGWAAEMTQAGQPEANHGRWTLPVVPTTMPGVPHNWFVTAVRVLS